MGLTASRPFLPTNLISLTISQAQTMKKTLLFLSLAFIPSIAPAQPSTKTDVEIVAPGAARELEILLPRAGGATVRDVRRVTLPAGRSRLFLDDFVQPQAVKLDTLRLNIEPHVQVLAHAGRSGIVDEASALSLGDFVGQKITLLRPKGQGEEAVVGTLLGVKPVLLETQAGVLLNPPGVWVLPNGSSQSRGRTGRNWTISAPGAGTYGVEALYQTAGTAGWSCAYTGDLSPARDRLRLTGIVSFDASWNTQNAATRTNLTLQDSNGVAFPWPADLPFGQSGTQFFDAEFPVTRGVVYRFGGSFLETLKDVNPQVGLSTTTGAGRYLPLGELTLWLRDESGALPRARVTKEFGALRSDEPITVPLDPATNVTLSRFVVSNKLLNPTTREIVIGWRAVSRNTKETITVFDSAPSGYRLIDATLKPASISGQSFRFVVEAPANEAVEWRYTVQVPA